MELIDLLDLERVRIDVEASSKKKTLEIVSELIASAKESLGASRILDALFQRERLGCTSIGDGIALPHARIVGLKEPVAAFVRLQEAIEFDAHDDKPVRFILGLIVPDEPQQDGEEQVPDIGALARRLADPVLRHELATADSAEQTLALLTAPPTVQTGLEANG